MVAREDTAVGGRFATEVFEDVKEPEIIYQQDSYVPIQTELFEQQQEEPILRNNSVRFNELSIHHKKFMSQ